MHSLKVYRRLLSYVMRYKVKLALLIGISLIAVVFEIFKPLPVKIILDNILSDHPFPQILSNFFRDSILLNNKMHLLILSIISLVIFTFGSAIVNFIAFNYTVDLSQSLVYDLSVDLFSKLQRLSLRFHASNKVGDLLQRMNGDVFAVYFVVAQIILPFITSLVCLTGMFYVMLKIDVVLALVAFSVVP